MKRSIILFVALFGLVGLGVISSSVRAGGDLAVGATFAGFTLPAPDGKLHSYNELKGENGTVIVFLSVQCPVVKAYNERISQLAADYKSKGINFIGINSNYTETLEDIEANALANYMFPVLIDKGNVLADEMGATVTPEIYYFNSKDVLLYEGAIDNDRRGNNVTTTYARAAFDEGLSGKSVSTASANAFGCTIKRIQDKK